MNELRVVFRLSGGAKVAKDVLAQAGYTSDEPEPGSQGGWLLVVQYPEGVFGQANSYEATVRDIVEKCGGRIV